MILRLLMFLFTPLAALPSCHSDEHLEINYGSAYCESNQPVNPLLPVLWKI